MKSQNLCLNNIIIDKKDHKLFKISDKNYYLEIIHDSDELQKRINTLHYFEIKEVKVLCKINKLDLSALSKIEKIIIENNIHLLYLHDDNILIEGYEPQNIISKTYKMKPSKYY